MPDEVHDPEMTERFRNLWDGLDVSGKQNAIFAHALAVGFDVDKGRELQSDEWDALLARVASEYHGAVGEEEFTREYDRVIGATTFSGEGTGETRGGAPTKEILHTLADTITAHQAMAEIFDNVIDNYIDNIEDGTLDRDLEIQMVVHYKAKSYHYITIRENSGGISEEQLDAINQPGVSETGGSSVSTFGQGTKISLTALGQNNIIATNHITDQNPVYYRYDNDYYKPNSNVWAMQEKIVEGGWVHDNRGVTEYTIGHPTSTKSSHLTIKGKKFGLSTNDTDYASERELHPCRHLVHWLGLIYAKKFIEIEELGRNVDFTISSPALEEFEQVTPVTIDTYEDVTLGLSYEEGQDVYNVLTNHLGTRKPADWKFLESAFMEGIYFKRRYTFEIPTYGEETRSLDLKMKVMMGATESTWQDDCGAWLWGNGRLFAESVTSKIFGGGGGHLGVKNTRAGRLFAFVEFEAENPRDIPWGSPIKWEYNPEHPAAMHISRDLKNLAYRFLQISSKASSKGLTELMLRAGDEEE